MSRPRKPVVHALDARSLSEITDIGVEAATSVLASLEAHGLRIARVPGRPRFRHADTGEYVSAGEAARNPDRVVSET